MSLDVARQRAAHHEASHAVACLQLGLPIIKITIAHGESYLQRGYYQQTPGLAVEFLSIMSLAGSEGEKLFFPPAADGYGDSIDLVMVRRYLRPRSELEFISETARLHAAARRLVEAVDQDLDYRCRPVEVRLRPIVW
jgi:hypothetical protein